MRLPTVEVVCSECGKHVRAYQRVRGLGVDLARPHTDPATGRRCWGWHRHDHAFKRTAAELEALPDPLRSYG